MSFLIFSRISGFSSILLKVWDKYSRWTEALEMPINTGMVQMLCLKRLFAAAAKFGRFDGAEVNAGTYVVNFPTDQFAEQIV